MDSGSWKAAFPEDRIVKNDQNGCLEVNAANADPWKSTENGREVLGEE